MKKKKITKKGFIDILYDKENDIIKSKNAAEEIINKVIKIFHFALSEGYTIELRGLGTFSIKIIPEREQVWKLNNNDFEQPKIFPECKSIIFKPSIILRKIINKKKPQNVNTNNEVKKGSKPATTSSNNLMNATKKEVKEALNAITEEAKRMSKKDLIN